jgi:hypothetical protein
LENVLHADYGAKSTVSDSWSTDVLASDSEPPEQNQLERLEEVAEEMVRQNLLAVKLQEVCALVYRSEEFIFFLYYVCSHMLSLRVKR